jgi:MFS family permease
LDSGKKSVNLKRSFQLLMFQTVAMQACYFAIRPMVSYRALELGGTTGDLGIIAGAFGLASLVIALPVGRLLDHIGPGRMCVQGTVLEVIGALIALTAPNTFILIVAASVMGIGHIIAMSSQQLLIASRWPEDKATSLYNTFSTFVSVGQALGPAASLAIAGQFASNSEAVSNVNPFVGLFVAVIFGASAIPAALSLMDKKGEYALAHKPKVKEKKEPWKRKRNKERAQGNKTWGVMLASAIVVSSQDVLITFIPAWAVSKGVTPSTVGWLLFSRAIFTLLVRTVSTRLVKILGRNLVLRLSIASGIIGFSSLPFINGSVAFISMLFLGIGLGIAQPMTLIMLMDNVAKSERGQALGIRMLGNRVGQFFLPLTMGQVAAFSGVNSVWWATAGVTLIALSSILYISPEDKHY